MLEQQLKALFELYGEKMAQDMRTKLADDGSSASGAANASIEHIADGKSLSIIGNDYLQMISEGRNPGPVSREGFKRIQDWVRIRGLSPDKSKNVLRYKDIAYVVTRKVIRDGYKGTGLFQYVIDKNIVPLSQDVADLILEVVGKELDQTITANFSGGSFGTAV